MDTYLMQDTYLCAWRLNGWALLNTIRCNAWFEVWSSHMTCLINQDEYATLKPKVDPIKHEDSKSRTRMKTILSFYGFESYRKPIIFKLDWSSRPNTKLVVYSIWFSIFSKTTSFGNLYRYQYALTTWDLILNTLGWRRGPYLVKLCSV
jgi:hypothetical protein